MDAAKTALPILPRAREWLTVGLFLVGAALFALAYCQAPLYYSNQNQYFLHGLAAAGEGLLAEDWLAKTRDPTPIFSALVALTARYLPIWTFYIYYGLLLGAYAAAMLSLFVAVVGKETAVRRWPVFVAAFVLVHSALARWLSYRLLGLDYPLYFHSGVAGQYILGAMLQPSTLGVLLVVAIASFVHDRPILAACCIALAATIHSTYLLPGALLTLGFLTALVVEGRARAALSLGAMTFVLVLPAIGYVLSAFGPTSAAEFARAQDIVANFRIPHHARVERWLDPIAALQLAWVAFALFLVWRTRLFIVLGVPFVLMMLLTLVQVVTGNDTLALLFPWRVSAVLVPVATTVILSRLAALRASERGRDARNSGGRDARAPALDTSVARIVCGLIVFAVVAGGVWISVDRQAFRSADEELPLMDFVRQNRKTGDVYLLPVQLPDLKKAPRGSRSGDFKPLAERKTDKAIIPIGLQRFRLYTGTPIFVDFKSIPYEDIEVIEWFERIRITQRVQEQIRLGRLAEVVPNLRRWGVTHLVQPTAQSVPRFTARTVGLLAEPLGHGAFLAATALVHARGQLVYEDPYYQVYRVVTTGK